MSMAALFFQFLVKFTRFHEFFPNIRLVAICLQRKEFWSLPRFLYCDHFIKTTQGQGHFCCFCFWHFLGPTRQKLFVNKQSLNPFFSRILKKIWTCRAVRHTPMQAIRIYLLPAVAYLFTVCSGICLYNNGHLILKIRGFKFFVDVETLSKSVHTLLDVQEVPAF